MKKFLRFFALLLFSLCVVIAGILMMRFLGAEVSFGILLLLNMFWLIGFEVKRQARFDVIEDNSLAILREISKKNG